MDNFKISAWLVIFIKPFLKSGISFQKSQENQFNFAEKMVIGLYHLYHFSLGYFRTMLQRSVLAISPIS